MSEMEYTEKRKKLLELDRQIKTLEKSIAACSRATVSGAGLASGLCSSKGRKAAPAAANAPQAVPGRMPGGRQMPYRQ